MIFNKLEHVTPKWANFSVAIECPNKNCKDDQGHAGLFPHPFSPTKDGYRAYCVKCGSTYTNKEELAEVIKYEKEVGKSYTHDEEEPDYVNYQWHHKTNVRIRARISNRLPNESALLTEALLARGYSQELIGHLKSRGFQYYSPEPLGEKTYLYNMDPRVAGLRLVKWHGVIKQGQKRYRVANPLIHGILIPLYYEHYLTGFSIRNTGRGEAKYIPFCHPRKELSQKQAEVRIMMKHTFVRGSEGYNNMLYVCEGPIKAEVMAYYFKKDVVGALSATGLRDKNFRHLLSQHKEKEIVIVPDADYKTKYSVALNYWKLIQWLKENDFNVSLLEWKHPDEALLANLKGIDDALVQHELDGLVSFRSYNAGEFFYRMDRRARSDYTKSLTKDKRIRPGSVVTEDVLSLFENVIVKDDEDILSKPDLVYKAENRVDNLVQALAKHKLVVDISPTGSGKSHAVGLLDIGVLNAVFIDERVEKDPRFVENNKQICMFDWNKPSEAKQAEYEEAINLNTVKKIKYISQSPINNTVGTLNRFSLVLGRNSAGWTYDTYLGKWRQAKEGEAPIYEANCPQADSIITLKKNRQILNIQKDICEKCPLKSSCQYLEAAKASKKAVYQRLSIQSLKVQQGDIVVLDDPGSIEFFNSISLDKKDLDLFFEILAAKNNWKSYLPAIKQFVSKVFNLVRDGRSLRSVVKELEATNELNYDLITKWLQLPEPDSVNLQKLRMYIGGDMEIPGERYHEFKKLKRWFFSFLNLVMDNQLGEMFFEAKSQSWVIKGIDPKFRDMFDKAAAILILDATANKEFFKDIFGVEPFVMTAEGDPYKNVKVTQVEGFGNTYSSSIRFQEAREAVKPKIEYINKYLTESPVDEDGDRVRKAGVITFKSLLQKDLEDSWHPDLVKGYWFCDERASNTFYHQGVNRLYLMGIPTPNIASIAAEVGTGADLTVAWVARKYGPKDANGKQNYLICRDTADTRLRKLLWYRRASSYVQALGRLRSLQRPDENLELFVLDSTPLPFAPDNLIQVDEAEKKEVVSLANNELTKRTRYFDILIKYVEDVKKDKGNELTLDTATHLNANKNVVSLYKMGVSIRTCTTCDDIIKILVEKKLEYINNPSTLYDEIRRYEESAKQPIEPEKKLVELYKKGLIKKLPFGQTATR